VSLQQRIERIADEEGTIELDDRRDDDPYPDTVAFLDEHELEIYAIVCDECKAEIKCAGRTWEKHARQHRDKFGPKHSTFSRCWVEGFELEEEI
jgi:hypothetical protein